MDFTKIRIAFFDIDGTLIDMQRKQITEKTLEMLRGLQANGIRICIATGRGPYAVPKFPGVKFDAYLTYNGACCYTEDGLISSTLIPEEQVRRIIRNAAEWGIPRLWRLTEALRRTDRSRISRPTLESPWATVPRS